jgi:nitroimidazol reductase NimA-like FMN-containing flavoprotein (pyridoxamine 5'-phosphate oxidase superfamily)
MSDTVPSGTAPVARATGIVDLDLAECHAVLVEERLCTMAVVDGDEPYAVPLFYGFDGARVFLGISEGRKTRVLDANPRVCLSVTQLGTGDAWRSVQIRGRVASVTDAAERARGVQVLMAHNRRPERAAAAANDSASGEPAKPRHSGGRILVVEDAVITGRAKR